MEQRRQMRRLATDPMVFARVTDVNAHKDCGADQGCGLGTQNLPVGEQAEDPHSSSNPANDIPTSGEDRRSRLDQTEER
jgi:hypothetical protein